MDAVDRRVLGLLQGEYPVCERPYEALAAKAGLSEEEFWGRVEKLISEGVIRRIGASMDSAGLGFSSTLAAVRVEEGRIEEAAVRFERSIRIAEAIESPEILYRSLFHCGLLRFENGEIYEGVEMLSRSKGILESMAEEAGSRKESFLRKDENRRMFERIRELTAR